MPEELMIKSLFFDWIFAPQLLTIEMAAAMSSQSLKSLMIEVPLVHSANAIARCAWLLEQGTFTTWFTKEAGFIRFMF